MEIYKSYNKIRLVTAASLFDGHDAAINIMRRILQASGAEVIHLGHNRSVSEIVDCAIQEDVQGIAITSYQGGHIEFFKFMFDLLKEKGAPHIKIFGGGGGTILPTEIEELHTYGICRIYSPDDGRKLGLQGMINDLLYKCDFSTDTIPASDLIENLNLSNPLIIGKAITHVENINSNEDLFHKEIFGKIPAKKIPVIGITGTGGAGKSSLTDELIHRFKADFPDLKIGIICIDPTKRKSGGALLGDRIRMNSIYQPHIYVRSVATRQAHLAINENTTHYINILKAAQFDLIVVETSGIGQSDSEITSYCDLSLYVMTPEYGAPSQLEKIDMIDFADVIAINKFDKSGAKDALRDVQKQFKRSRQIWESSEDEIPVVGTMASQFNDEGTTKLYLTLLKKIDEKTGTSFFSPSESSINLTPNIYVIPPNRVRYLADIADAHSDYLNFVKSQKQLASSLYQIKGTMNAFEKDNATTLLLQKKFDELENTLHPECKRLLTEWEEVKKKYAKDKFSYCVRNKEIHIDLFVESLSGLKIPKVVLPQFNDWGDILEWLLLENVPGEFPYTAGVFPFKRREEDPTRMFAGEGGPERTNRRFHFLAAHQKAKRLSTAFDSVTLYGEDPAYRPDIYGKVGNSGVSVATLDDAKKLYSGFNLCDPYTSVSMTINGPAPFVLAFFLNTAIDQQCELYIKQAGQEEEIINLLKKEKNNTGYLGELLLTHDRLGLLLLGTTGDKVLPKEVYERIKKETLKSVRGTVQADILKEDQAQNTCIFSTEFALRMMGDVQEYFINNEVKNFYSVSISGYHIAEAGANPITQLAFTLSNAFTYVEYYLSRGMDINDFAPNFSFFFSNGLDPEYSVIGRVARRIWATTIKNVYNGNSRSQMLKYHIQTSGRSLHAQEIAFNDIRTTLQALYAINDNCNSLHTNAYDEAITTPTEESVRRAVAIQQIINHELGLAKNENPLQGSFIIEKLTNLVETAVMEEFRSISERGGVIGAMERMYQRSKIQEESLYYETLKHEGKIPIIGVNTFLAPDGSPTIIPNQIIRADKGEKENAIHSLNFFIEKNKEESQVKLKELQLLAGKNENIFDGLMDAAKVCTLGQITHSLYEVGGKYRRNM